MNNEFDRAELLEQIRTIEADFAEETVDLDEFTDQELVDHANKLVDRLNCEEDPGERTVRMEEDRVIAKMIVKLCTECGSDAFTIHKQPSGDYHLLCAECSYLREIIPSTPEFEQAIGEHEESCGEED